jgi:molecular chaperone DnaK
MTTVSAEKGKANIFQIELRDPTGALQEVNPKTFQITVKGTGQVQITLPHSIGVALADNSVAVFFEKGTVIPARKRKDLRTAVSLHKTQSGQALRVPVVEGNKSRADRNRTIGTLIIPGKDNAGQDRTVMRDVPAGSEIEVTIEIDQSRLIRTKAFVPILDDEFDGGVLPLESPTFEPKELSDRLAKAKERLRVVREKTEAAADPKANDAIQRVDSECMVPEAERLVSATAGDADAGRQCENLLNSLESALDDAEDALEWPALVQQAENELQHTRKVLDICKPWDEAGKRELRELARDFEVLERETREAIQHRIPDLLRRRVASVSDLGYDVKRLDPGWWVGLFEDLKAEKDKMTDSTLAARYMAQGDRAMQNNDFNGLKEAVRGLAGLLPKDAKPKSLSDVTI